jgi:F0F1-type ATP synthase assembly protein I
MKADGAGLPTSDDHRATSDLAWRSVSTLMAGILLYGGIGWLIGKWLGHQSAFMAAGAVLGIVLALYLTYVRVSALDARASDGRTGSGQ